MGYWWCVLDRKQAFTDKKNLILDSHQICFFRVVGPWFWLKKLKIFHCFCAKKGLEITFGYVLNRKEASMGYENTRDDFETAAKKLMEYFVPRKHHLFKMYESRKLRVSGVNGHWGNSNLMSWTSVLFNSYWLTRSHWKCRQVCYVLFKQRKALQCQWWWFENSERWSSLAREWLCRRSMS